MKPQETTLVGDAYLVVARTNLDEIPIELCPTLEHARIVAHTTTEDEIHRIASDAGVTMAIIVFLGGKPIDLEISNSLM